MSSIWRNFRHWLWRKFRQIDSELQSKTGVRCPSLLTPFEQKALIKALFFRMYILILDSNVGYPNVGPMSVMLSRHWAKCWPSLHCCLGCHQEKKSSVLRFLLCALFHHTPASFCLTNADVLSSNIWFTSWIHWAFQLALSLIILGSHYSHYTMRLNLSYHLH